MPDTAVKTQMPQQTLNRRAFRFAEAHVRLIRPNALTDVLLIFFIGYAMSGGIFTVAGVLLPALLLASSLFFSNAINDIYDVDIDKANSLSERPLVSGALSLRAAWSIVACWALVCLVCSVALGGSFIYLGLVLLACGLLYSHPRTRLSHKGLVGTAVMASAYFVLPVWVAVAASGARWSTSTILFTLAITLIGIARLLLKDYRDLDGDKKLGKATPLIIYGPRVVKYLVILFLPLGLIVLCTLLGKEKSFSVVESLAIMLVALVGLAASLVATRSTQAQGDHPRSVIATFLLQRLALVLILVSVLLG